MKPPSQYPVLDNRPIDQWRVTELKEELKRRKLTTKGLKEDLVKRLDEAIRNENESTGGNVDNGLDDISKLVVETDDAGAGPAVSKTTGDMMDCSKDISEVDAGMDKTQIDDSVVPLGEGKVQEGEIAGTGGSDSARDKEMEVLVQEGKVVVTGNSDSARYKEMEVHVQEEEVAVTGGSDSARDKEMEVHVQEGEVAVIGGSDSTGDKEIEIRAQEGDVTGGTDSARDEDIEVHVQEGEVTVPGGSGSAGNEETEVHVQEGEVTVAGGFDSARDDETEVRASSVKTSITVNESVVSETVLHVQESQNDSQDEREVLKSQLENDIKRPHEDFGLNSSDQRNQVSEVTTVLGFQVKSDSISSDCVSINEKNELKDNIIDDNVKLDLDVKPEMVQPSSSDFVPDRGQLHPMDVEEPQENKLPVEDTDDNKATNAEISKRIDSADFVSSEKLNLDRSSGDDSMEDDAPESKQIDSKFTSEEVGDTRERIVVPVVKEEDPISVMLDDIPVEKKNIHEENKNASAALTVKRKLHDQEAGNIEVSKRQRKWNSENLKVPEPKINIASSTTPKDSSPATTLKRNFSRSDSTASDDLPKERVVPQSPKPPTNSLRIDRFLRPFTLKAVQELLGKTGSFTSFWMDHIKTHCYVTYSSVEEAIETRNAVYNLQWPPNGGRLLVAEFVDPQEVKMRAEAPQSPATPVSTGPTMPPAPPTSKPQPTSRQQAQRQQLPPPPALPPPPPLSNPPPARERLPLPPPPPQPEKVEAPIVTLDDLFRKTKATPRIYYLPLSDEQVSAKLKAEGKGTKQ